LKKLLNKPIKNLTYKSLYAEQQALTEKYPKRQKAFTSKYSHFGHIAASRGEGGHHSFKR
jgi:hypothetical protein